jgi:hypothetical protein
MTGSMSDYYWLCDSNSYSICIFLIISKIFESGPEKCAYLNTSRLHDP